MSVLLAVFICYAVVWWPWRLGFPLAAVLLIWGAWPWPWRGETGHRGVRSCPLPPERLRKPSPGAGLRPPETGHGDVRSCPPLKCPGRSPDGEDPHV